MMLEEKMRFNQNLSAIHGYLCSDGYVIKNPPSQKQKYYKIGLRNTNNILLKDFQQKFKSVFGLMPHIMNDGRCAIGNKDIYHYLTKDFSYYSYEWKLPKLNKRSLSYWLKAFFDCEGWVENQPAKSRLIGADCCNELGLLSVKESLQKFGIFSNIQNKAGRTIWRLTICGLDDLKKFQKHINFLHPDKNQKLIEAIDSYRDYYWKIPTTKNSLLKFLLEKGRIQQSGREIRFFSIKKRNMISLKKVLKSHKINSKIFGPWENNYGSLNYCLTVKNIEEVLNGRGN